MVLGLPQGEWEQKSRIKENTFMEHLTRKSV